MPIAARFAPTTTRMLGAVAAAVVALLVAVAVAIGETAPAAEDTRLVPADGDRLRVLVAPIKDAIDPVSVEIVESVISEVRTGDFDVVLFELNTPGGLVTSMDEIVAEIINARDVPVVIWVTPRNARAASAGTFIMMASDVAAMSPNTTIGSASVVAGGGGEIDETLEKKITNDAVAKIRGLARDHGRNEEFAEAAVREAENLEASEALEQGVIEIVAESRSDLFTQLDGMASTYKGFTFSTTSVEFTEWEVPARLRFLKVLINPNWIFLLLTLGIVGIGYEVTNPGTIFPGTIGLIAFLLAMYGLQVLPTNTAGLALLALAAVLFVAEVFVSSGGILGVGGAVSLVLGGLLLFDREAALSIDLPLLLTVGVIAGAGFTLIGRKVYSVHHEHVRGGSEGMVDQVGTVRYELAPRGQVFVAGELWQARTDDGSTLPEGAEVIVAEVDGLTLVVREHVAAATAPSPGDGHS